MLEVWVWSSRQSPGLLFSEDGRDTATGDLATWHGTAPWSPLIVTYLQFTLVMSHDIISVPKVVMSVASINTALECCRKCAVSVGGGGGAGLHVLNGNLRPPVKMTLTDGKHYNTLLCSNCPTASN